MSRDDRKYSRFYYREFQRDYPDIYANDAAFSAWMRLLATAEEMWPTPPSLPRSLRARVLNVLVDRGLICVTGHTYQPKGFVVERTRRSDAARRGSDVRWGTDGDANADANA